MEGVVRVVKKKVGTAAALLCLWLQVCWWGAGACCSCGCDSVVPCTADSFLRGA